MGILDSSVLYKSDLNFQLSVLSHNLIVKSGFAQGLCRPSEPVFAFLTAVMAVARTKRETCQLNLAALCGKYGRKRVRGGGKRIRLNCTVIYKSSGF